MCADDHLQYANHNLLKLKLMVKGQEYMLIILCKVQNSVAVTINRLITYCILPVRNGTIIDGQSVITIYGFIIHAQLPARCVLSISELRLEVLLNRVNGRQLTQNTQKVSPTGKESTTWKHFTASNFNR